MQSFKANRETIQSLPVNKKEIAEALLDKAEFMEAEMQKLQETLKEVGWVEEYKHGQNQYGTKRRTEADAYLALGKNYNATLKAISELCPDSKAETTDPVEAEFFK